MAVAILAGLGYAVTAVSGKYETKFLQDLGASDIIPRQKFLENTQAPMLAAKWAAVVDTVGVISWLLRSSLYSPGEKLPAADWWLPRSCRSPCFHSFSEGCRCTASIPSIITNPRQALWNRLALDWKPAHLKQMATLISLDQLPDAIDRMLQGQLTGRTVVNLA